MKQQKRSFVEWAMHYRKIVILVICCLVAFGIYSLPEMQKNEFPDYTIRQGVVVAVVPGVPADEVAEQVTKPLEDYIFSYKEVKKEKTFSKSTDGMAYIQVELNEDIDNKDEFWNRFKHGVNDFKAQLPQNVLAIQVMDDFGDTSALLITMESDDKTYRELSNYMDALKDSLRRIESVGRMTVSGMRREQIAIYVDNERLAHYGLSDNSLAMTLAQKGFVTTGGRVKTGDAVEPIYVEKSLNSVYDIQQTIVHTDPAGRNIRLKDVADVRKEYPAPESYIENNGKKCLLLSVEMKKNRNIVDMGREINKAMAGFQNTLPAGVSVFRITDQSKVVSDSVYNFLKELLIAVCAVVIVVMLLLPMKVALVAASTIPITIFTSLGLFHAFGIELNTVTLAALIVTLGIIVDDSIIIIDNYLEQLGQGVSRWKASVNSTLHFFRSILSATLAISITFFPFLFTTHGMLRDFLVNFPWAITIILGVSLLVATFLVPFMQFWFIRKPMDGKTESGGRRKFSLLDTLQSAYDKLLDACFAHPKVTVGTGVAFVAVGAVLINNLPQEMMPTADRNQFAVEIYMPTGTSLERTSAVADSMASVLRKDDRVVSVTEFKGCSSPRFHTSYAPQTGGSNYAQFIVNTTGVKQTVELLDDYAPRYTNHFPDAYVRFKQLSYSEAVYPVEVRLSGENPDTLKRDADKVLATLRKMPDLTLVRTDMNEHMPSTTVRLKADEAARLGVSNLTVESTLAMRYGTGVQVATVWEDGDAIPVTLKSTTAERATNADVADEKIPAAGGLAQVPLRQVADITPSWKDGCIARRNGVYTVTVQSDVKRGVNSTKANEKVVEAMDSVTLSPVTSVSYGGEIENNDIYIPQIVSGLAVATVMIFFILMFHFKKISLALLVFSSIALCTFGTAASVLIQGINFSVTCYLGVVSLMGIIVRNGIIMVDYAEELRSTEDMRAEEAIYHSAKRRMRPIFLTSAAASMGVIPMILGGTGLWMPMGTVVCYGTLLTMLLILTVLPAAYLLMFRGTTEKRKRTENIENE